MIKFSQNLSLYPHRRPFATQEETMCYKLSMNPIHELTGKCHLFLEKKGALIVREQAS